MKTLTQGAIAFAAALALAQGAQASTVYSGDFGDVATETDTSYTASFSAGAGTSLLAFHLDGFSSLDGWGNGYTDVFTLNVNGVDVFSGSWDLGGGGDNVTLLDTSGQATVAGLQTPWAITWAGGALDISLPIALQSGTNTLTFTYTSPTGHQGLGDEGWGLGQVTVSSVPEPASLSLLLAGLGVVGVAARRRASRG